jgi:periplasmic protein TonB
MNNNKNPWSTPNTGARVAWLAFGVALVVAITVWLLPSQKLKSVGLEFNAVVEPDAPSETGDQTALAMQAYTSGKLFAPAGENALEHYLNARQAQPNDYSLQEAVLELLPAAMDALEVAMNSQDQAETNRLFALLTRADPKSARLVTLKARWDNQQLAVAQRQQANQILAAVSVAAPSQALSVQTPVLQTPALQNAPTTQSTAAIQPQRQLVSDEIASRTSAKQQSLSTELVAVNSSTRATPEIAAPIKAQSVRSSSVIAARAIRTTAPVFPAEARRRKVQGWVDLELELDTKGQVVKATVTASEPTRIFDVEARRAALRWQFTPKLVDDTPTASTVRRRINFNLNG